MSNSKKFCHSCGKEVSHTWRFCAFCQNSLSSLNGQPSSPPTPKHQQNPYFQPAEATVLGVNDQDDEDISYLDKMSSFTPRLDGLQLEIEKERPIYKETLGGAISSQIPLNPMDMRPIPTNIDEQTVIKEFQKEASAVRP